MNIALRIFVSVGFSVLLANCVPKQNSSDPKVKGANGERTAYIWLVPQENSVKGNQETAFCVYHLDLEKDMIQIPEITVMKKYLSTLDPLLTMPVHLSEITSVVNQESAGALFNWVLAGVGGAFAIGMSTGPAMTTGGVVSTSAILGIGFVGGAYSHSQTMDIGTAASENASNVKDVVVDYKDVLKLRDYIRSIPAKRTTIPESLNFKCLHGSKVKLD